MSRRDGIENLLGGAGASAAPTVTEMRKQANGEPTAISAAVSKPEPKSTVSPKEPAQRRKVPENGRASKRDGQPVRFQVSAPAGSEVERALMEALDQIPEPLRAGVNIGTLFRSVLKDNDAAIAAMIRNQLNNG